MNQSILYRTPVGVRTMYVKVIPDVLALGLRCGPIALLNLVNSHFPSRTGRSITSIIRAFCNISRYDYFLYFVLCEKKICL
jgi:hypothetical protein